jgi:two-component system, cell cycle sensor histidine kinase and response regulator CckA
MIALAATAAYLANLRIASDVFGQCLSALRRALPLLITAIPGITVACIVEMRRRSEIRKTAMWKGIAGLVSGVISARDNDEISRLMFQDNPLPIYVYDCKSLRLLDANQAATEKYGYSRAQFLQLSVPDVRLGMTAAELLQEMQARHGGFNQAGVWRQRRKDGSVFLAVATVVGFAREGRKFELVLANDVTERVEAEAATRQSRERLRSLVDRAPFGVCRTSLVKDRVESANQALCEMLGYSETELLGLSMSKDLYVNSPNRAELIALLKRERKLRAQEAFLKHKDGRQIRVRLTAFLTPGENSDQVDVYVEDLTEQSALEQQIRAVQKLEAVGRLAGGVAHDFNNILVVIKLSTDMMLNQITPDSPLSKPLLQVSKAADRATALTTQMLAFSRRQMMQARVVNVNSIVSDISHLLRRIIGEDVRLVTTLTSGLANTKLDPDQLGQVVLNLAVNARDAMPGGGTLQLETSNVELDEAYAKLHPPVQPGNYVLLAVSDTGTGIAKSDLPHIFDPFFTTKEMGKGTGLGLSIVYGIVKQSGGYIWVYSEPGQGTTFKLYFPATNAPPEMYSQRAGIAGQATGQTILVVEDEAAIRSNVCECLEQLGYGVLEADSGEAALQVCERKNEDIDLVMTDLNMPGIGGKELARQLVERFPDIPVLFTSGYTEDTVARREMLHGGSRFLAKPFSVADLSSAVRRVLATRPCHSRERPLEAVP